MQSLRFALLAFFTLHFASCVHGAHVLFNLADFTSSSLTNKVLGITPLSTPRIDDVHVITSDRRLYTTDSSGTVTVSNMVYGNYKCELTGPHTLSTWTILVPTNTGTLNATGLISSSITVPNASTVYTRAQSDARYPLITDLDYLFVPKYFMTNSASSSSASAVSLLGSGVGTTNLPAFTNQHRALRIFAAGTITSAAVASNLTFAVGLGSQTFSSGTIALTNSMDGAAWTLEARLSTMALGTNATFTCSQRIMLNPLAGTGATGAPSRAYVIFAGATTVNTQTNNPIVLTAQFNIGGANGISCSQLYIEQASY